MDTRHVRFLLFTIKSCNNNSIPCNHVCFGHQDSQSQGLLIKWIIGKLWNWIIHRMKGSWLATWLKRILIYSNDGKNSNNPTSYMPCVHPLSWQRKEQEEFANVLMLRANSHFWADVFKHYKNQSTDTSLLETVKQRFTVDKHSAVINYMNGHCTVTFSSHT